jgi:carnitine-CoA ligase
MDPDATLPRREECVVGALLQRWAVERPERIFLEFDDGDAWTFADTLDRVRRAAGGLYQLGVRQGSYVLCWMPNQPEAVLGWFAVNYLGAIHVPLNTAYRGRLLRHAVELSGARVMLAHASLLPRLAEVDTARLREVVVIGGEPPPSRTLRFHGMRLLQGEERAEPERPVQPWDVNYLMLTSGTTGPSKAVVCTYVQSWTGSVHGMDYFDADDRLLANLPLFHVSGNITGCCLVGAMTQFLLRQPPDERDREHPLRNVITVPWNEDSRAVAQRYGLRMHTAFNMTELAVPIRSAANPRQLGTCGRPRPGIEARVVDAHDLEVPHGVVGELVLRASRPWEITQGYHRDPHATAAAWRNGWFHTGDAFRRDAAGNYFFVDRIKDAIRRRGENISSFEVEAEALCHPAVLEAAAVAVPSDESEDEVLLIVSANEGCVVDPLELLRFLEPRLAHFMLPRYVRVIATMPKTPTAKIEKHRLRSEGLTVDTWDREAHGLTVRAGRGLVSR